MRVCVVSASSETIEVIIVKLGTVTATDMGMHHVLIILTVTFKVTSILILKINKCLIIFRNYSSNAHYVCSEDSHRLKVYMTIASPMTLTFTQDHK